MRAWTPLALLAAFACADDDPSAADPGTVVLHRLNRAEYDNTVRDLFGTSLRPADDFPADDFSKGFDNIAAALSVSSLHVELYEAAADDLVDELFAFGNLPSETTLIEAEGTDVRPTGGGEWDQVAWALFGDDAVEATIWVGTAADHLVAVEAYQVAAGDEPAQLTLRVDGADVAMFDVANEGETERYELRLPLAAGSHTIAAAFLNDYEAPPQDRTLIVDRFVVTGPLDVPRLPSPSYGRVITCDPAILGEGPCAEEIVRGFGRRAFRRPLGEDEVAARMAHYSDARGMGGSFEEGIRAALKSILLSPWFVYRVEPDPIDGPRPLNSFEIASRLSYFLWSSMPDDRLLDLAESGQLTDPDLLEAEARRMFHDPRAEALIENLGGQWLGIRKVDDAVPDRDTFPTWDDGLGLSMKDEMTRFVASILLADRSVIDLFTEDTTFVDARLAEHYGVTDFSGTGMVETTIPNRNGLLTKGAVLAGLAYPTRTAPVLRGKWVLENLMCDVPPDPPPDIPAFEEAAEEGEVLSVRDQLERHREDPMCAGCHDYLDPIGLGLEGYDGIGTYRTTDEFGLPVNATGEISGVAFDGAQELQVILATDERLPGCVVEKTMTYALGRAILNEEIDEDEPDQTLDDDRLIYDALVDVFGASNHRFEELVVALVRSRSFRWKVGEAP